MLHQATRISPRAKRRSNNIKLIISFFRTWERQFAPGNPLVHLACLPHQSQLPPPTTEFNSLSGDIRARWSQALLAVFQLQAVVSSPSAVAVLSFDCLVAPTHPGYLKRFVMVMSVPAAAALVFGLMQCGIHAWARRARTRLVNLYAKDTAATEGLRRLSGIHGIAAALDDSSSGTGVGARAQSSVGSSLGMGSGAGAGAGATEAPRSSSASELLRSAHPRHAEAVEERVRKIAQRQALTRPDIELLTKRHVGGIELYLPPRVRSQIHAFRTRHHNLYDYSVIFVCIVLFFVYPMLVETCFRLLSCVEVTMRFMLEGWCSLLPHRVVH